MTESILFHLTGVCELSKRACKYLSGGHFADGFLFFIRKRQTDEMERRRIDKGRHRWISDCWIFDFDWLISLKLREYFWKAYRNLKRVRGLFELNFKLSRCLALWEVLWTLLLRTWAKRGDWENSYLFHPVAKLGWLVTRIGWMCWQSLVFSGLMPKTFRSTDWTTSPLHGQEGGCSFLWRDAVSKFCEWGEGGYLYGIVVLATKQ